MRPLHLIVLAVLIGAGFAISNVARGHVLSGLVGGVLAAILVYVVMGRFEQQHEQRRRNRR
jgi:uncharacterized protein (DUF2062 family)